jgi:hypothetical protein
MAATTLTGLHQHHAFALADNWNERLEWFTSISGGDWMSRSRRKR